MRKSLLSLFAVTSLLAADYAAEGKLWWAHIQFLADDALEGRNTGSEGLRKAVAYASAQFDKAGLKPAGTNGFLQPIHFDTRSLVEGESSVALVRDGKAEAVALGQEA